MSMLANAKCVDRAKIRRRGVVIKEKVPSSPLANRQFLRQLSPTFANSQICIFPLPPSSLIACIEDSAPDKLANDNIGTSNRLRSLFQISATALPARIHQSTCTTELSVFCRRRFTCLFEPHNHVSLLLSSSASSSFGWSDIYSFT